jgi:L-threonylcarbamoyladenylate synthase
LVVAAVDMRLKLLPTDDDGLDRVAKVVKGGGLIVYPTETLYGIGCDPFNQSAFARARTLKGREGKAFPVLVSGVAEAEKLVVVGKATRHIMEAFWPGALTLVLKAKAGASMLGQGTGKIGVRMPKHELALKIIGVSGGSLVGTSANLSGMPPARAVDELDPRIEGGVDLVVDGGPSELGLASTVLEVQETKGRGGCLCIELRVIRKGALGIDAIKRGIRQWGGEGIEVAVI